MSAEYPQRGVMTKDLLGDRDVGQQHPLLYEGVGFFQGVHAHICRMGTCIDRVSTCIDRMCTCIDRICYVDSFNAYMLTSVGWVHALTG